MFAFVFSFTTPVHSVICICVPSANPQTVRSTHTRSPLSSLLSALCSLLSRLDRSTHRRQPYPDNYTDDSFLARLVLNGRITPRRLSRVILDASTVSQQVGVVTLKASAVAHLLSGGLPPHRLMLLDGVLLLCGVSANVALHGFSHAARQSARVGPPMLLGLFALSPLFRSMTSAISDDTAVATATCSLLLHLLTHDYAFLNSYTARLGSFVSLGAAMFAAALLASRLSSTLAVFADVTLAVTLFVLFPFLRRDVRRASVAAHVALTLAVHAAALAALVLALPTPESESERRSDGGGDGVHHHHHHHPGRRVLLLPVAYVALVTAIVVICPAWLMRMMAFKEQINGPWDEAKPDFRK